MLIVAAVLKHQESAASARVLKALDSQRRKPKTAEIVRLTMLIIVFVVRRAQAREAETRARSWQIVVYAMSKVAIVLSRPKGLEAAKTGT